jgi:DNA-binding response OmpR family regulator
VQVAFDGYQGESMIRNSRYDIVLIDFKLPGTTGVELLKRVKVSSPDSKFFLISGRPFIEKLIKKEGLSKTVSGYVKKPFDVEKFLEKIKIS